MTQVQSRHSHGGSREQILTKYLMAYTYAPGTHMFIEAFFLVYVKRKASNQVCSVNKLTSVYVSLFTCVSV